MNNVADPLLSYDAKELLEALAAIPACLPSLQVTDWGWCGAGRRLQKRLRAYLLPGNAMQAWAAAACLPRLWPSPALQRTPAPAPATTRMQARMLPTLCGITSQPAQHSPILVDGAVELITLALAPSGVEAARQIHEAATPAMLQVGRAGDG